MIRHLIANLAWAAAMVALFFVGLFYMVPAHGAECRGQSVLVSWYGAESGNRTASGLHFNGNQMLAAHKSLPFGTRIKFTYKGRSIVVPVQDRGPYIKGRTFDLSRAAAAELGFIHAGVARVCAERVR